MGVSPAFPSLLTRELGQEGKLGPEKYFFFFFGTSFGDKPKRPLKLKKKKKKNHVIFLLGGEWSQGLVLLTK